MIPQDKRQPGPPGRVTIWGHPWHGLVEDGVLTLPNAATMPYSIPTGAGEADVLAFQPPGTPAVSRTPDQAAADTAAGRQWLDYALISGRGTRRLYGKVMGGSGTWLYAAPDGSRWRVTLGGVPGIHDLTTPWITTVTCARFGEFGGAPETHVLDVTLSDWQQAISGHAGGDYAVDFGGVITTANVTVEDVRRDGSQAVLMVGVPLPTSEPLLRNSLGFLVCDLTGTPGAGGSATLTVARSRAQTLGTRVFTLEDGMSTLWTETISSDTVTFEDVPPPPVCGGVQREIHTPGDPPVGSGSYSIDVGTVTITNTLTGRILGMLYDADGQTLAELTLSATNNHTVTSALTHASSGQFVRERPHDGSSGGGSCSIDTSIAPTVTENTWLSTSTATQDASGVSSLTLAGPGGEVSLDLSFTSHNEVQILAGFGLDPYERSYSYSFSITLGDHTASDSASGALPDDPPPAGGPWTGGLLLTGGNGLGTSGTLDSNADGYIAALRIPVGVGGPTGLPIFHTAVRRYSATLAELLLIADEGAGAWECLGAVGLGVDSEVLVRDAEAVYGSAHPVTGEIARASDVPVCWV